ncbi:hypothetical protein ABZP36_017923 [Zizania latifolia]
MSQQCLKQSKTELQHIRRRVVFSHKVLCSAAALLLESGNAAKDLFGGANARVNAAARPTAGASANPLPAPASQCLPRRGSLVLKVRTTPSLVRDPMRDVEILDPKHTIAGMRFDRCSTLLRVESGDPQRWM